MLVQVVLLVMLLVTMIVLYYYFNLSNKQSEELEQTEEIYEEISLKNKSHQERKSEARVLRQLKEEQKCKNSNSFPEIEFWEHQGKICNKASDCKLIFEDELKDMYEPNELPLIDNINPSWTIGMWIKSNIEYPSEWVNIFRRMEANPVSLKDRRPAVWFVPKKNSLQFTYAVTNDNKNSHRYIEVDNAYKKDEWVNVVWVQNNKKGYIYINGELKAVKEHDIKPELSNNTENLYISPRNNHAIKKFSFCATPLSHESVRKMYKFTNN